MNDLPRPQQGSGPFGSPQSGFPGPGSPLVSPPTGTNGRRILIAALIGIGVIGAAVAVFATRGGSDESDRADDLIASAEAVTDSALAEAETALSEAKEATDESLEQLQEATENIATIPVEGAPSQSPAQSPVETTLAPVAAPTTPPPTVLPTVPPPVNLFEGDQISGVVGEIATARGADPLRILKLVVYPEYLITDVQDPTILENVDQYTWRGKLRDPAPVRLTGNGELEPNLFSSNEVSWAAIPPLIAAAPAAVGIADGVVSHVIVHRNLPFSDDITMRVFVRGERTDGYLDADASGAITGISD